MSKTFASLFTGFGLADVGAKAADCELAWGVEIDSVIAEVSQYNLKHQIQVASVLDCDPHKFEKPDILWASPPCPNFSVAKANRAETDLDRALAQKIVDFLKVLQPQTFILENVEAYKRSNSLEFIEGALYSLGYWVDRQIVNFADYGVPQTRKRLILRAVRGGWVPGLPPKQAWKGWYQAVEDIIDTLPETQLAKWQIDRLPADLLESCLLDVGNTIRDCTVRSHDEPSITITAEKMRRPASTPKAVLVSSQRDATLRVDANPATTVVSVGDGHSVAPKALLIPGSNASSFATRLDNEPANTIGDTNRVGNIARAFLASPHIQKTIAERIFEDKARAFLVDGIANNNGQTVTIVDRDCPSYTVKASAGKQASRAWLEQGRVVQMTSRALARFQTMPDWYTLPEKNALACRGIGNGVPCLGAEAIVRSVMEVA